MSLIRLFLPSLLVLLVTGCASLDPVGLPIANTAPGPAPEVEHLHPPAAGGITLAKPAHPDADSWSRLRDGFSLQDTDHKAVSLAISKYSRSPRDVEDIFHRGEPYIAYILNAVRERNYPAEIALLPFVESGFDPYAYSHGRAAGLWQFIPGTGKMFGLKQDWWYDERRDIMASTDAAMNYLGKLQQQFDGDWLLALAAYNSGSGTVRSAMRRNRKAGKPVDFWHLKLPKETRVYVPRLLAITAIVNQPGKYGITLPPLATEPAFTAVDTGGQLDIGVAADLAGVETKVLYGLNPGFNRWATHPDGPHRLLVPAKQAELFKVNLAALSPDKRIKWVRHRIRKNQTLSHIARQYDTTVAVLRNTNDLSGTTIRTGKHLLVPVAARDASQYAALGLRTAPGTGSGGKTTYKVRNGDNLWNIARQHHVSVKQLARWNLLSTAAVLRPGQKLAIWTKSSAHQDGSHVRSIRYTVRSGDSLSRISKKFDVSIAELRRWNKLSKNKYLQPGQRLKLYIDVTRLSSSS